MVMGLWRMQMETSVRGHGNRMRALTKVSVKLNADIEYFDVGVYVWANGIKAPVSFKDGKICFGQRLIYPDNDYRLEYRGEVKDKNIMHGKGTLTLKSGSTFEGNWVDD